MTTRRLQKLYKELLESGRIHVGKSQNKDLSTTTVHSVHLMLHCALGTGSKGAAEPPQSCVNCIVPKLRKLNMKILQDAGLGHLRFHDLRHTFATTALQNGVDVKTVSSMLGHFDAGFTLRTYTHATRQKQDEAAQTMGNFMEQVR